MPKARVLNGNKIHEPEKRLMAPPGELPEPRRLGSQENEHPWSWGHSQVGVCGHPWQLGGWRPLRCLWGWKKGDDVSETLHGVGRFQ